MRKIFHKAQLFYTDARNRAQRRKSIWNLVLIPFCFAVFFLIWYMFFRLVWSFHIAVYPSHHLEDFWGNGIGFKSFFLSFLMVFSLTPGSLALAFILGNLLFHLIPRARKVFDDEAKGYSGTGYRESLGLLLKVGIWALSIGFIISLTAAFFLKSLK